MTEEVIKISFPEEMHLLFSSEWEFNDDIRKITQINTKDVLGGHLCIELRRTQWLDLCIALSFLIIERPKNKGWATGMRFIIQQAIDDINWR